MKITIIGAGNVGGTVGKRWAENGHAVRFGVRDPQADKVNALLDTIEGNTAALNVAEAATFGEVIVLATPWDATEEALKECGNLTGKVLVDCTNPWRWGEGLLIGFETSGGERVAELASGARVVKTLNQTGYEVMADPRYGDKRAVMFICGDDDEARKITWGLIEELDFEVFDVGDLSKSRFLEPMAALWIDMALNLGFGRSFAFALLQR